MSDPAHIQSRPPFWTSLADRYWKKLRRPSGRDGRIRHTVETVGQSHDLTPKQAGILRQLLHLDTIDVEEVMVTRSEIVAVPATASIQQLIDTGNQAGHSRLPVFGRDLDDIIGMIHMKDLLSWWGKSDGFQLSGITRPILTVAPSTPVTELLGQMQSERCHIAIVADEHGGTDGLVTIEDLLEEIVGEIEDEHDQTPPPDLVEITKGVYEVDGRYPLKEFEEQVGINLRTGRFEDVESIGGLVIAIAGEFPAEGQRLEHNSLELVPVDVSHRAVLRVQVLAKGHRAPG